LTRCTRRIGLNPSVLDARPRLGLKASWLGESPFPALRPAANFRG
jgi:hypothetical protein